MPIPFVSVLIDTYNYERFIEAAIESVLAQDYPASQREILVVDDGSTDRTPEILCKFENQVRILRKSNGGQAATFNAAMPECHGQIIAFLDGDDWWAPTKLRRVAEQMAADEKIAITGHGIKESYLDGTEKEFAVAKNERLTLNSLAAARVFRLRKSYLGTSRMTLRAERTEDSSDSGSHGHPGRRVSFYTCRSPGRRFDSAGRVNPDSQAIEEAVLRLANSAEVRQQLGQEAQRSMKRYTWKKSAQGLERLFRHVIASEGHISE